MTKLRYTITIQFDCVTANPKAAEAEAAYTANQLRKRDGSNARVLAIHASGIGVDSLEPAKLVAGTDFETVTTDSHE